MSSHSATFKPTIVVALRRGNSSGVCITPCSGQVRGDAEGAPSGGVPHHLVLSLGPRSSEAVCGGWPSGQVPAAPCGWKGGRYTVRE